MKNVKQYKDNNDNVVCAIFFNGWNWGECKDFIAGKTLIHPSWMREYESLKIDENRNVFKNEYIVKSIDGILSTYSEEEFNKKFSELYLRR